MYDSSAQIAAILADGSTSYRGFTPKSVTGFDESVTALSAIVGPFSYSDPNGSIQVANDVFTGFGSPANSDAFIVSFDPAAVVGSTLFRNFEGFDVDGWRLVTARMLWIEGLVAQTPEFAPPSAGSPTPDFLGDQALPTALPTFAGKLWFDFQNVADPSLSSFAFFNNLQVATVSAVPEPQTYALLLAGLGLLGFVVGRRRI
jgi:hypothetical protein